VAGLLPTEATRVDPVLAEFGAGVSYQTVVFGQVKSDQGLALVVVQLTQEHPHGAGIIGRYYATQFAGLLLGKRFRPWSSTGLGEVFWDPEQKAWVQATGVPA
jgi:hypothetical protein